MTKPVLITLTAPTCSGKSHLLNYIRELKLPCLISTTTRAARAGEVEGLDYYFIDEATSKAINDADGFVEYVHFNGAYYGVTHEEYAAKLAQGPAFLIVEPLGLAHYAEYAQKLGIKHVTVFVDCPEQVRVSRLNLRLEQDLFVCSTDTHVNRVLDKHLSRLQSVLGAERQWKSLHNWDLIIDGRDKAENNLALITNYLTQE